MQVKTYIDRDMTSALARAREELGPDALVLSSRESLDEHRKLQTEITVGVERARISLDARAALRRLAQSVARRETPVATAEPPVKPKASDDPIDIAVASLVRAGLSRDLATRFARIAGPSLKSGPSGRMARAAERGVAALLPFGEIPTSARVLFVVGPPGAGKTSSVAKLAARAVEESRRPVVYAMADTERVGALAESSIYAKHVGCELQVIDSPGDLTRTLHSAGRHTRVLIDTPGIGAADTTRLAALGELRRCARNAQVALVVPTGLHRDEVESVFERFAPIDPTCVAFSKVDDGRRVGDLVTALAGTDLPLSFMTNGHRIPDDLVPATPRRLAALLLRAGRPIDNRGRKPRSHTEETLR